MTKKKTRSTSATSGDRTRAYATAVVAGEIIAGPHVRNACRRHLKDLEDGHERGLYFDEDAAAKAIGFFEDMLRLSGGQFEGIPFKLHCSQAFKVGSIFGWKKADGMRRFRRAYIEEGKGNGKSPLAAGIGLYGLTADGEAGAEVYPLASHRDQAMVLFRDAVSMVKQSPRLARRIRFSGGEGKEWNIAYLATGSFMRPLSREAGRTGSGPRPYFGLADEVHEFASRASLDMLERGFKSRRQPLLLMTTNSGTDLNSVCREEHEHAVKVAAGNIDAVTDPTFIGNPIDDDTFSFVASLDAGDDPLEDPSCWVKANPLLGVTITEDYLASVVKQARSIPGKRNAILRLHFCVWTDAETAWMTRELLEPCIAHFDPSEHHGKSVCISADLSQNRDITALAFAVQTGRVQSGEHKGKPTFDVWVEAFTPRDTMAAREIEDNIPYRDWVQEGHLNAPKGVSISFRHVAQAIAEVAHDFDVRCLAYDRYAYKRGLEPELHDLGLSIECVEHPQGGYRKGKPSEQMTRAAKSAGREPEGLWFPGSLRDFEDALLEGRIRLKHNKVLISAIMSAVTGEDRWNNRWLAKERTSNKIDAAVAAVMVVGAAMAINSGATIDDWLESLAA